MKFTSYLQDKFPIFKKKENILEKKGYLLVVANDRKEKCSVNLIFNRGTKTFDKKKIFAVNMIPSTSYFKDICECFSEINYKREYKRLLAERDNCGIYYVETKVIEKEERVFVSETTTIELFYVPSKMELNVDRKAKRT